MLNGFHRLAKLPTAKIRRAVEAIVMVIAALIVAPQMAAAQETLDSLFLKFGEGQSADPTKRVLFLRRSPIVISFIGFDELDQQWMGEQIAIYAYASGLPVSVSGVRANIRLISAANINDGDRLNLRALIGIGVPEETLSIMSREQVWSSGCGIYHFRSSDGSISESIGIIDKELSLQKKRPCLSFLIYSAFGVGNGLPDQTSLPIEHSVFKIALILNVVSTCERMYRNESLARVESCISEKANKLNLGQ